MRGALRAGVGGILAGLVVVGWPGVAAAAPATPAPGACAPSPARAQERAMMSMIAARRRVARAPKVRGSATLLRAGRAKSVAMARGGRFAHGGQLPWAKGRAGGQNIAMARSAAVAFRAMVRSPSHHANILSRSWRFAAVGASRACSGHVYFTVNFLGPPGG
jgi:uncharacterized protein YkwD